MNFCESLTILQNDKEVIQTIETKGKLFNAKFQPQSNVTQQCHMHLLEQIVCQRG